MFVAPATFQFQVSMAYIVYLEIWKGDHGGTFQVYIFKSGQNLAYFFHIKF